MIRPGHSDEARVVLALWSGAITGLLKNALSAYLLQNQHCQIGGVDP